MTQLRQQGPGLIRRLGRTLVFGLVVAPLVCALTFGALVLSTEAMFGATSPGIDQAMQALLIRGGWMPPPSPTPLPSATATLPSPQPTGAGARLAPAIGGGVLPPPLPASLTPTSTDTPTETATSTVTATDTASATVTSTPTWSPTPSASATVTATASRTATPSRTPSRTPSPPPTATRTASPTPSDTPTDGPSPTPSRTPTATVAPSATPSSCTVQLNTSFETTVESLINGARADNGLSPLSPQSQLRAAARVQATDMACNGFLGHTGSDGSNVGQRVNAQGYSWSWIGENYMVTSDTTNGPYTAFNWWMNSTPHRNNILGSAYTEFGVGYIYGPDSDYRGYFVVVFARPG